MYKRWIRVFVLLVTAAVVVSSGIPTTSAHHAVLRFNLEEMTEDANRIFVGQCIAVEETEEMIAQGTMAVTRYTFKVERAIKGKVPETITFRQIGHPARRAIGKGGEITMGGRAVTEKQFFHGMSEYRTGDRMVLFLVSNYMRGTLTRPVGLYQGAFEISRMPSGKELVRNGINNTGLLTAPYNGSAVKQSDARVIFPTSDTPLIKSPGASVQAGTLLSKRGALPLEAFLGLVEQIVTARGGEKGVIIDQGKGAVLQ